MPPVKAAIARLFDENHGGEFTTEQFRDSLKKITHGRRLLTLEQARQALAAEDHVVPLGEDLWFTNDSRED